MGKRRGSWLSAVKRILISYYREKPVNDSDTKIAKEKKKGKGILRHGENRSFIPLFREPSSIEKILGEADQQNLLIRPPTPPTKQPKPSPPPPPPLPSLVLPRPPSPGVTSQRVVSPRHSLPRPSSPKVARERRETSGRSESTLRDRHVSATKIQAAYRGYTARRSFRSLKGLVRLQRVMRGQNVKRQAASAMRYTQLLVRLQAQIQSRRIQVLDNQSLQQNAHNNDGELQSSLSKCTTTQCEAHHEAEEWDESILTKKEMEGRWKRKVEAVMKRERAMAYASSHQLRKASPKSGKTAAKDIRSDGFPWWWKWLKRELPPTERQAAKNTHLSPPSQTWEPKPSPRPPSTTYDRRQSFGFDNLDSLTPRSTRSAVPTRTKPLLHTPPYGTPSSNSPGFTKYSRPRNSPLGSTLGMLLKDDDSLASCPPFSVPNYMAPTASAKAKVRANSNPKERLIGTPNSEFNRKLSLRPFTPNIGSSYKGSNKEDYSTPQRVLEKHPSSLCSIGDLSLDSPNSVPASMGRKPFNRFV